MVSFIPSGFTTETPIHATRPAYLIVLHVITRIVSVEQHKSLCSFSPRSVTSSLLVPNISLSTLLSNTLCLCYSLNVSDQVSHPHRAAGRIITCLPTANLCVCVTWTLQQQVLVPLLHETDCILIFLYLITILKEMNAGKKLRQI